MCLQQRGKVNGSAVRGCEGQSSDQTVAGFFCFGITYIQDHRETAFYDTLRPVLIPKHKDKMPSSSANTFLPAGWLRKTLESKGREHK